MHTFHPENGVSEFEFAFSPKEQAWLVGDFNEWGRFLLPMRFESGRWVLRVRLQAGRYACGFLTGEGLYCFDQIEVPLWFGKMTEEWLRGAAAYCTCNKHFWKWN